MTNQDAFLSHPQLQVFGGQFGSHVSQMTAHQVNFNPWGVVLCLLSFYNRCSVQKESSASLLCMVKHNPQVTQLALS
jgi:hypothetical protein